MVSSFIASPVERVAAKAAPRKAAVADLPNFASRIEVTSAKGGTAVPGVALYGRSPRASTTTRWCGPDISRTLPSDGPEKSFDTSRSAFSNSGSCWALTNFARSRQKVPRSSVKLWL